MNILDEILEVESIAFTNSDDTDSRFPVRGAGETVNEAIVHHFTGFDRGQRQGGRKHRPTADPNFRVDIRLTDNDERETYSASIVANAVPDFGNVERGEPVAIAKVALEEDDFNDDSRWFMLISADGDKLALNSKLVTYHGDPQDLLEDPRCFETD